MWIQFVGDLLANTCAPVMCWTANNNTNWRKWNGARPTKLFDVHLHLYRVPVIKGLPCNHLNFECSILNHLNLVDFFFTPFKKLLSFPDYCCCCCRFHLFDVFQWKTTTPTGKKDSFWIPFCCSLFCLNKYPFTTFIDRTFSSNDGPARNRKEKRANSLD